MEAFKDLWIVAGIMVIFFVIWIVTGGPERALVDRPEPLIGLGKSSFIADGSGTSGSYDEGNAQERRALERELENVQDLLSELEAEFAEARTRGLASPYEGLVSITSATAARRDLITEEYLVLRASRNNTHDIVITGWILESAVTGSKGTLGQAANLPSSGSINTQTPVVLPPGGEAIIRSGRSPIGTSFRVNLCVGYLDQYQRFEPALPLSCPRPEDEFEQYGNVPVTDFDIEDDAREICRSYVEDIPRCTVDREDLDDVRPKLHNNCRAFIEDYLSYPGCVSVHKNDFGFYQNQWYVYLGKYSELWREEREIIKLLDAEGRTVDLYDY